MLTLDQSVRLHSCEKGTICSGLSARTVWIKPIITRVRGTDVLELGAGGGAGDLKQYPELDLQFESDASILMLLNM